MSRERFCQELDSMDVDESIREESQLQRQSILHSKSRLQSDSMKCERFVIEMSESSTNSPENAARFGKDRARNYAETSRFRETNEVEAIQESRDLEVPRPVCSGKPAIGRYHSQAKSLSHYVPPARVEKYERIKGKNTHTVDIVAKPVRSIDLVQRSPALDVEERNISSIRAPSRTSESVVVPSLHIIDLSEITPRFSIAGKILNNYGTYKIRSSDSKYSKYFKADLVDNRNSDTITVVVGEPLIEEFKEKLAVGEYVRIEGASIKKKNKADGGTSSFSLYLDSGCGVTEEPAFPVTLSFYPEIKIRAFLDEGHSLYTRGVRSHLGTLAFVVIQSENLESKQGATRGELLVADGFTASDRATLTFVNDRKDDYSTIVRDIDAGRLVMYIARNIGIFMTHDNTLLVLDLTVLLAVQSERLRTHLTQVHERHMETLGYGKEVSGVLTFTNINGVLLELICYLCKSNKVHRTGAGAYCLLCVKAIHVLEVPHLHAKIFVDATTTLTTQLIGPIVDKILHLEKPFRVLYMKNVMEAREALASVTREGHFKLNRSGNVIEYREGKCS